MTSDERWLTANWPFMRAWLPAAPAQVLEIGCGPQGGFVPMMQAAGYPFPSFPGREVLTVQFLGPGGDTVLSCYMHEL